MPSFASHVLAMNARVYSALSWRSYYPLSYQRYTFASIAPRFVRDPAGVSREAVSADGVPAEWLIPEGEEGERVILYLHGGAYVLGCIESHWKMVARMARAAGCRALLIDYRLAPEHPFPAGLEDCLTAYRWLMAEGYAPESIVIAGDSAGGGLTASSLVALRDAGDPLPAAAVMLSPATDLEMTGDSFTAKAAVDPMIKGSWGRKCVGMYLAGADPRAPLASPLYAELGGLPPMLIQVGAREVLLDDSLRFATSAKRAGCDVELEVWRGMFHVWQFHSPVMPESNRAIARLGEYCREKAGTTQLTQPGCRL